MTSSALWNSLDYLVSTWRGLTGMGGALAGVLVGDGPPQSADLQAYENRLYVGYDPRSEEAAVGTQDFANIGARQTDETFTITCYAESWSGDNDMAACRARVRALVDAAAATLAPAGAQPPEYTLGGNVLWARVGGGYALIQEQLSAGAACGLVFHISCRARLS